MRSSLVAILALSTAAGCESPRRVDRGSRVESPGPAAAKGAIDDPEARRAWTRAQFEADLAGAHGAVGHSAAGCPACSDPMAGQISDDALIVGPAKVWN